MSSLSTGSDDLSPSAFPQKTEIGFLASNSSSSTSSKAQKNEEAGELSPRAVTQNRYVSKKESKIKVLELRFKERELFDTLHSFPWEIGHVLDNGFILSPKMYIGIKRRGTAYLDDFFLKNPEVVLTEAQKRLLYDVFTIYNGFILYDDLLAWIQNERAELQNTSEEKDDALLKEDLRFYHHISKEQEAAQKAEALSRVVESAKEKLRVQMGADSLQEVNTNFLCKYDKTRVLAFFSEKETIRYGHYGGICPKCDMTYGLGKEEVILT